jgi:curved DNA-binding protein CbpA
MTVSTEFYDKLGVSPDATQDQIKKAFRKKAKDLHPDHNHGDKAKSEEFKEVSIAYNTLSDPNARRRYDTNGTTENVTIQIRQEALSTIIQMVTATISQRGDAIFFSDFFQDIKKAMKDQGNQELKKIKLIKKEAKKVDRILKKIIHKDGENSFLYQALSAEKNKMLVSIAQNKLKIKILKTARLIIAEYQFQADQQQQPASVFDFRRSPFPFNFNGGTTAG